MLTESGSQSLKKLPLCQTMVSHLYDIMIAEDYKDCVVEVLSQLDIVIIKVSRYNGMMNTIIIIITP